jgi:hypothetical protein
MGAASLVQTAVLSHSHLDTSINREAAAAIVDQLNRLSIDHIDSSTGKPWSNLAFLDEFSRLYRLQLETDPSAIYSHELRIVKLRRALGGKWLQWSLEEQKEDRLPNTFEGVVDHICASISRLQFTTGVKDAAFKAGRVDRRSDMIAHSTNSNSRSKHCIIHGDCSHSTAECRDANKPVPGNADYKKSNRSYQDRGPRHHDHDAKAARSSYPHRSD